MGSSKIHGSDLLRHVFVPSTPRVLFVALFLVLFVTGCGSSRYDRSKWPESPFPEAKELLAIPRYEKLKYFKEKLANFIELQVQTEIWADMKFDFDACLKYFYLQEGQATDDCVKAVTFQTRYPLASENATMGLDFLGLFEKCLKADLSPAREAYNGLVKEMVLNRPFRQNVGNFVVEACCVHQVNRGDFLTIGVYEKAYYDKLFRLP